MSHYVNSLYYLGCWNVLSIILLRGRSPSIKFPSIELYQLHNLNEGGSNGAPLSDTVCYLLSMPETEIIPRQKSVPVFSLSGRTLRMAGFKS